MAKHLQLTLIRAIKINATTTMSAQTKVYAKVSYKNAVYTTTPVIDMGQNPVFAEDGTNVCHFVYEDENEAECITIELFNRNRTSIGHSKLSFTDLGELKPEQDPEEKTLQVLFASGAYPKLSGHLVVTAQIKLQKAEGEHGMLNVVLKQGNMKRLTSILGPKTTKMNAKLTYKHTTLASGTLEGMGNKFMWHTDNTFTFLINSSSAEPGSSDVLEIEVYNGANKVGECKIQVSLLIPGEDGLRADPRAGGEVTRTAALLHKNKNVGSIEVAATFTKTPSGSPHSCNNVQDHHNIGRRNAYPQDHAPPPQALYPPPHHAHHRYQPEPASMHFWSPAEGSPSSSIPPSPRSGHYPHENPHPGHVPWAGEAAAGPYEPSAPLAPPAMYPPARFPSAMAPPAAAAHAPSPPPPMYPPAVYPLGTVASAARAHGAPPRWEEGMYSQDTQIAEYIRSLHGL